MKILIVLAVLAAAVLAEQFSYEGYKVYNVAPSTQREAHLINEFQKSPEFDFWSEVRAINYNATVMVSPKMQAIFEKILKVNNIEHSVLIEDVEKVVQEERTRQAKAPKVEKGRITFTEYHRYDVIQDYLVQLAQDYPERVTVEVFANSYEGRPIRYIRIGTNPSNPTIFLDGAIHAREWIAPPLCLYIIQQLVENPQYAYMSENINWVIIPVLNPDGYEYSHTNQRMWRKTRSSGTTCYGVDGNRNYDYEWGGLGTSNNECSDIFRGPAPFSEPETAGMASLVGTIDNVVLYLAIHSFGQWLLYPWGYDVVLPDNAAELQSLGEAVAASIYSVEGTSYTVGNSAALLYAAAGASDDWMMARGGAPLSYTVELPGGGSQGFDLPASRIDPVVRETWPGIVTYYEYVATKLKNQNK